MTRKTGAYLFVLISVLALLSQIVDFTVNHTNYKVEKIQRQLAGHIEEQALSLQELEQHLSENSNPLQFNPIGYRGSLRAFDNGKLIYWNDNKFIPQYSVLRRLGEVYVVYSEEDIYLVSRLERRYGDRGLLEYYAVSPLLLQYPISNEYLTKFLSPEIFGSYNVFFSDQYLIKYNSETLFGVSFSSSQRHIKNTYTDVIFILVCILLLLYLAFPNDKWTSMFLTFLLAARLIKLLFLPDAHLLHSGLNDSTFYFDSWWLPSMGDLLLNQVLLALWVYHTMTFLKKWYLQRKLVILSVGNLRWFVILLSSFLLFGSFKLFFDLIWSMNNSTVLDLDISSSLALSSNKLALFGAVFLQSLIVFFSIHLPVIILKDISVFGERIAAAVVVGLFAWMLIPNYVLINWLITSLAVVAIHLVSDRISHTYLFRQSLGYLFIVGGSLSVIIAYANYEYNQKILRFKKEKFASSILLGHDVVGELYIDELSNKIKNDPFIRSRFLNTVLAQQNIKVRVNTLIPVYLDKYEVTIHTYDSTGAPYGLTEDTDLEYWRRHFAHPEGETGYENIYLTNLETGKKKYVSFIPIDFYSKPLGHIVLEITQKKFLNQSVFPSLLVERNPFAPDQEFDHAIYEQGALIYAQGKYDFETQIDHQKFLEMSSDNEVLLLGAGHLLVEIMQDDKLLFIASETYKPIQFLSNIAFYILNYVIFISLLYSIHRATSKNESDSLSRKIQLFIGTIFLIPILVVIVSLLQILNGIYLQRLTQGYEQQAINMAEQISSATKSFESNSINRDQYFFELKKAGGYGQTDIIVYDRNGRMMATSRSEVFKLNLIDERINPLAFNKMGPRKNQLVVLDERIGNLKYKNVYTGIYDPETGKNIGYLSLPFFNFQKDLAIQQRTVFQNLIILVISILGLTLVVSQYSLQRIIQPIKTIAARLRDTSYLSANTPVLTYNSKDEIGQLVTQYNQMVSKLAESKKELVAIQKESAWKEIARQVAHEIKNPLTPMRLKIQQLQAHFDQDSRQYQSLDSLFAQVDALALIADSFSEFAKMPAPQNEVFDLSMILKKAIALFQSDDVLLETTLEEGIKVNADPKILSQIFNNLILNGIQSHDKGEKVVNVSLKRDHDKVVVRIKDNGSGISEDLKEKIFKPYFSTKSTGSGIGLALAKKGVEQANGAIWFDSKEGEGTTFFISLPIYGTV